MTSFTVRDWLFRTGWQLNKTYPQPLLDCSAGRQRCAVDDFKPVLTPQGLCYSINWNESDVRYSQKLPGLEAGFNFLIDIEQPDYTSYKLDSRLQYECGAKVLLHEPHDECYSGTNLAPFIGIDPGRMGFLSVQKNIHIRRNEWPWSQCEESTESCKRNCIAKCTAVDTIQKCNCRLWFETTSENDTICGVARSTACLIYKETGLPLFSSTFI